MRFRLSVAILIILSAAAASCSDARAASLLFREPPGFIQPGETVELDLRIGFSGTGDKNIPDNDLNFVPDRESLKRFAEPPDVKLSAPGFRLVSVVNNSTKDGINAGIIIRADDNQLSGRSVTVKAGWDNLSAEAVLTVRKDPSGYIDADGVITDAGAYDAVVNKKRRLPADYIPEDLVKIEVPTILSFEEVNYLRKPASDALSEMFAAAKAEKGYELLARSGYRSYKTQVSLYELNVREYGEEQAARISARPGTSEHQSGLAMDISSPVVDYQLTEDFGKTDEGRWIAENSYRFGFIIRYPKDKEEITGYAYEPWHLRWVGKDLAAELYAGGFTLEEYFGL